MSLPNPFRGEVKAVIDDKAVILRLSLGALASLESSLTPPNLINFIERFEKSQASLNDVLTLIGAAMPDALDCASLGKCHIEGGIKEAYALASKLLIATFGDK